MFKVVMDYAWSDDMVIIELRKFLIASRTHVNKASVMALSPLAALAPVTNMILLDECLLNFDCGTHNKGQQEYARLPASVNVNCA